MWGLIWNSNYLRFRVYIIYISKIFGWKQRIFVGFCFRKQKRIFFTWHATVKRDKFLYALIHCKTRIFHRLLFPDDLNELDTNRSKEYTNCFVIPQLNINPFSAGTAFMLMQTG